VPSSRRIRSEAARPLNTTPHFATSPQMRGLDFVHINGASDEQATFRKSWGPAVSSCDFDNDGWLDVFLVDGGSFADAARRAGAASLVPEPWQRHASRM
jgi:hypothetical protein